MGEDASGLLGGVLYKFADTEWVRYVQRDFVRYFEEGAKGKVLDLGCGRGLFLELLRDKGIEGAGVDGHADSIAECKSRGFQDVHVGDVLGFLDAEAAAGRTYAGVFCSHLIEHFPGDAALRLVAASARVLAPGGRVVLVTPNVANLEVWTKVFWLDPTHVRPYPRKLVEALFEGAGLRVVRSYDDRRTRRRYGAAALWKLPLDLMRHGASALTGMDSIVVGERPA